MHSDQEPFDSGADFLTLSAVALGVAAAHLGALYAASHFMSVEPKPEVKPPVVMAVFVQPEQPAAAPPAPPPPVPPPPVPPPPKPQPPKPQPPKPKPPAPTPKPVEMPVAIADPTPAPNAPVGTLDAPPAPPAPPPPPAGPSGPPGPPSPAVVEPSSNAAYLNNPAPAYPPASKRLGESGKTMLRVHVGADGLPREIHIHKSSGFDRLDKAAISTVQRWKFVPGTRGGSPEAMWVIVPINWVLTE